MPLLPPLKIKVTLPSRRHRKVADCSGRARSTFIVAAFAYGIFFRKGSTATPEKIKSNCGAAAENLSGDPSQDYFTDGITESLNHRPRQDQGVARDVAPLVMRYKGTSKPVSGDRR